MYDNLHPSRIIVGIPTHNAHLEGKARQFAEMLKEGAIKKDVEVLVMNATEAEAVKLFSNWYCQIEFATFDSVFHVMLPGC